MKAALSSQHGDLRNPVSARNPVSGVAPASQHGGLRNPVSARNPVSGVAPKSIRNRVSGGAKSIRNRVSARNRVSGPTHIPRPSGPLKS